MTQNTEQNVFSCSLCFYTTNRKYNLTRHENAKHNKIITFEENVTPNEENVTPKEENVTPNEENVTPNEENVTLNKNVTFNELNENIEYHYGNIEKTEIKPLLCSKCNKGYKTQKYLLEHEKKCKIVDSLTCPKCMLYFANRHSKNRHIKRNNCKARSIIHARSPNQHNQQTQLSTVNTQNNTNYTQIGTQINNHCTQINAQNIYINNYGSERLDYIDYDKYLQIFKKHYDIPSALTKEIHFNLEFPENNNILYNSEKTALVKSDDEFIYKDLNILVEELIKDKSRLIQNFARDNKDNICLAISSEIYEEIIELLLKLVLIKEPSTQYKRQVNTIMDLIRNTKNTT